MTDKKKLQIERELRKIKRQLKIVSGIKKRHELSKRQLELKKELKHKYKRK